MTFSVGDHFREVDTLEDSNLAEFYVRSALEFHLILAHWFHCTLSKGLLYKIWKACETK